MRKLSIVTALLLCSAGLVAAQETGRKQNPATDQNRAANSQNQNSQNQNANQDQTNRNATTDRTTQEVRESVGRTSPAGANSGRGLERHIVACLTVENQGEVEIAKMASQKASNAEVKSFAQQMVKDHSAFLEKLNRLNLGEARSTATGAAATDRADANTKADRTNPPSTKSDVSTTATDANRRSTTTAGQVGRSGDYGDYSQLTQIKQEIGKQCVQSMQRELGQKQGKEFDKCYIGSQVGAHMHMVDSLTVLSRHTTGELQQAINDGLETSQQHLEHAKQIAKQLEGSSDSGADRSSSANERKSSDKGNAANPNKNN
jgi:predicted outer membrane protein